MSTVELPIRQGQEGNRWVNQRPAGDEVATWFENNFTLDHTSLSHDTFIGGISLIQVTEKSDEVIGFDEQNRPIIVKDVQNVFFTPYPKVETRIAYFRQWMGLEADWLGIIEPVITPDPKGMPEGFNSVRVESSSGVTSFICCTSRVRILKRPTVKWEKMKDPDGEIRLHPIGEPVLLGPPGTKAVPLLDRYGKADANAIMKAQTGAAGRALGLAGIFVLPGTGVATAEDVLEAQNMGQTQAVAEAAVGGEPEPEAFEDAGANDDALRQQVVEMISRLESGGDPEHEKLDEFRAWAKERGFTKLDQINGPDLKGVVRKLQKLAPPAKIDADISGTGDDG